MKRIRSNKNIRFDACLKLQGGRDMFGNEIEGSVISDNDDVQVKFAGIGRFRFTLFGGRIKAYYYDELNRVSEITVDDQKIEYDTPEHDRISQSVYTIVDQQIKVIKQG